MTHERITTFGHTGKRPSQFLPGDTLADGAVVTGIQFVQGGVRVTVRLADGSLADRRYNGRRKYTVAAAN